MGLLYLLYYVEVGAQRYVPAAFSLGKRCSTYFIGDWVRPRVGRTGVENFVPTGIGSPDRPPRKVTNRVLLLLSPLTLHPPLRKELSASHFSHAFPFQLIFSYTECPRRNKQNFGRVFLMLNYTDITLNTYIQS